MSTKHVSSKKILIINTHFAPQIWFRSESGSHIFWVYVLLLLNLNYDTIRAEFLVLYAYQSLYQKSSKGNRRILTWNLQTANASLKNTPFIFLMNSEAVYALFNFCSNHRSSIHLKLFCCSMKGVYQREERW